MELKLRRILATEVKLVHMLLEDENIRAGALIGHSGGEVDLLPFISNEANIVLICEDEERVVKGAILFHRQEPGVYEVHTMAKREVRGRAYLRVVHEAIRIMFFCSDCIELWTRVPEGNLAALGLVRLVHGRRMFESHSSAYYLLDYNSWLWGAQGARLVERGEWFHERLQDQFIAQKREHELHEDNADHDRVVGATSEMILNVVIEKAIILYNRWAKLAGYHEIRVVVPMPLVIDIGDALLQVDFVKRDFLLLEMDPSELRSAA